MPDFDNSMLENALPVAPLKLLVMDTAQEFGARINADIVKFRKNMTGPKLADPSFQGYAPDSFLLDASIFRFGTGEGKGLINETIHGTDLFILTDIVNPSMTYKMNGFTNYRSPDDNYQDLKRMIAAASGKAKRLTVIMPFLYEGRQHKRSGRESLDCAYMLSELADMGVSNFITFDAHDPRVQNSAPLMGFDNYTPPFQFIKSLMEVEPNLRIDKEHLTVISPDAGALDRAIYFASVIGVNTAMFYKRRDYSTVVNGKNPIVAHEYLGDRIDGMDMIIMDDMISSGESMLDTSRQLKEMGANRVFICCTFGLFTNGLDSFDRAYEKGYFDRVITTNLTYQPKELYSKPYYVCADMAPLAASIIDFMNHDAPMSDILTQTESLQRVVAQFNDPKNYNLDIMPEEK